MDATRKPRSSYGIDAPYWLLGWEATAAGLSAWALFGMLTGEKTAGRWIAAALAAPMAVCHLHATRRGKFIVWEHILDELALRGDEDVLDLGCGRGAVLIAVARRLTTGRAVGVDLWRTGDQSGNHIEATRLNAEAAGVANRVDLHTGDMASLPFPDATFDIVVSNLAIHNISSAAGRDRAIDEALRVLRPGGRLVIADIISTRQYERRLRDVALDVQRTGLGRRMWWAGPCVPFAIVHATAR